SWARNRPKPPAIMLSPIIRILAPARARRGAAIIGSAASETRNRRRVCITVAKLLYGGRCGHRKAQRVRSGAGVAQLDLGLVAAAASIGGDVKVLAPGLIGRAPKLVGAGQAQLDAVEVRTLAHVEAGEIVVVAEIVEGDVEAAASRHLDPQAAVQIRRAKDHRHSWACVRLAAAGHRVLAEGPVAAVGVRAHDRVRAGVDQILAEPQRPSLAEPLGPTVSVEHVRPGLGELALLPE